MGYPIARVVGIISLASGAVLDFATGPYAGKETGEHALLRQLMQNFQPGDLAVGDAYYGSFFLLASFMKMGVDAVFPIHGARDVDFRSGEKLGKKDHIVEWQKPQRPDWMDSSTYNSFPSSITVREIQIKIKREGSKGEKRTLVTTLLDHKEVSRKDLKKLYESRWLVELDLRSIKQTMKMDILRGKTPEIVHKEIWAHLLAYNLIRKIIAQAAMKFTQNPRKLSFKATLQSVNSFRQAFMSSEENEATYAILLKMVASQKVGNQPGRQEPRKVRRRPKAYGRLIMPREKYKKS